MNASTSPNDSAPASGGARAVLRDATAAQLRRQAREAFVVETPIEPDIVYLLIDDVVTTGATIREASLRLREAGAKEVWVAVLVREALD